MARELTFDDLPPADQQLVLDARTVYEFFQAEIAPKLLASSEEVQRFVESPSQYLIAANCPVISGLSDEKRASMDAALGAAQPATQGIGCWICTKAIEVVITLVVVIGAILVAVVLAALAAAIATAAALLVAAVLALIIEVGIAVGSYVLAPHVEALAILVCRKTNACPS